MRKLKLLLIILVTLGAFNLTYALTEDQEQIASLAALSWTFNQEKHLGVYTGRVVFDQGTTHLRAHQLETTLNNENRLIYAKALGKAKEQAHYWTQPSPEKAPLHAYADVLEYYPQKGLIVLSGNAKLEQGKNNFFAPKIRYDVKQQHLVSKMEGQNRVKIFLDTASQHD